MTDHRPPHASRPASHQRLAKAASRTRSIELDNVLDAHRGRWTAPTMGAALALPPNTRRTEREWLLLLDELESVIHVAVLSR